MWRFDATPQRIGVLTLATLTILAVSAPAVGGHSPDEGPTETPLDPGDVFTNGGLLLVDDSCPPPPPPFLSPCLGVPAPEEFDLDGFTIDRQRPVCPPEPPPLNPGILFSLDDGDPGAGSASPDRAVELLFYDHCNILGGGSFQTNADEVFLTLGANPPPAANDDDVDAFEAADVNDHWNLGALVFSADNPSIGGLGPDPGCPGSQAYGTLYFSDSSVSAQFFASPCSLGVPDIDQCDIDAVTLVTGEPQFPAAPVQILFSTDASNDCGLDPADIYISDNAGSSALWADDVTDLRIALTELDPVDLDALSVNEDGPINPGNPFQPPEPFIWKRGWPDYAPSGVPDFSQDHTGFPTTFCGPTAVANCLWWFDSEMEGRCPGGSPGDGIDDFPLVTQYAAATDDHDPANVEHLVNDLSACMLTDPVMGTRIGDMEVCINQRLTDTDLASGFTVNRLDSPGFGTLACAVERSENVILLLGFWSNPNSRCGGHYVTSAGVKRQKDPGLDGQPGIAGIDDDSDGLIDERDELCPCPAAGGPPTAFGDDVCGGPDEFIAVSDPGLNNAETGAPGRVLGPAHADHAPAATPPPDHDDAENVSHDRYRIKPSGTGRFVIGLQGYAAPDDTSPTPCETVQRWCLQNPDPEGGPLEMCIPGTFMEVEIESMIEVSPVASGLCVDVRNGLAQIELHKGACPSPASTTSSFDYVRGELCQVTELTTEIDLGTVDCLKDDGAEDQLPDNSAWDFTRGILSWFYVVREDILGCDYGASSSGKPRLASSGDCPCP